eukprot:g865.t1
MNKYQVLKTIGKGTFGVVSSVKRLSDGKRMVWKELDYGTMNDKEKSHVVSEVNFLRELRHPFIVKYYDRIINKKDMKLYIVMESCEGGDLQNLIRKCKREKIYVREEKLWKMFAQLVLALAACHYHEQNGVVKPILHRDIKPGNVFLDRYQNIKIGDFGLAKELSSKSTFAYTNVGTPYYMSPELVNEDRYNESSDIWALGCLIFELASLRTPFDAHNAVALAVKINTARVPRIPSRYSKELNNVIHRMLQKSSKQRPTLKELQSMKGPNGVFERHIKEGCLRIREHRFNYRCLLEQRELKRERKDLKSREKKLRESEMEMETRERKLREREMEMERREMELRERETKLLRTVARTRRRSNTNMSSSSEMSTEEDTKSATLETPPTAVHMVGSDRRSSLNRRRVESSDSTSSIKIMSLAKTFEERMASLNRTPSNIVGRSSSSIASSPSELGSNLRPRLVRRESSSDSSSSSSEKIKLKAYMEYRRHAKLEFVSPKPVNKRGGVSRSVLLSSDNSSDNIVVDDAVLSYE